MKYFVKVENFMQMQYAQDDFLGFFTSVKSLIYHYIMVTKYLSACLIYRII